jgi:hypothetical protein
LKKFATRVWRGFVAAVTSPDAVKREKSFAAFVITRFALSVGASAGTVVVVEKVVELIFGS